MENVVAFNNELSSLYESKPPISKAKMAAITRAAMKAIKFYKHVVQSVEKFILKCKPEYKVPGLYVIDSIVRQSRHQFGAEKDVFAPRFARNMKQTFANLFRCAPDDKSRIVRVLNLWQKNNVFAPEVIQPLFDLADPNHPIYQQSSDMTQDLSSMSNGLNTSGGQDGNMSNIDEGHLHGQSSDPMGGHQTGNSLDQNTIRQLQQLQQILIRQTNEGSTVTSGGPTQSDSVKFNKKVLDYDYGEDEEEEKTASPHISNILDSKNLTQLLKDPNVLRQLQTIQKFKEQEEKQSKLKEMRIQEEAFEKHLQNVLKGSSGSTNNLNNESIGGISDKNTGIGDNGPVIEVINLEDGNDSRSTSPDRDRYKRRRSSRSRSRDRGRDRDRRRRSKSRSRSRSPRSNRRRTSRERDRSTKDKERDREKEKEKEYERERRRKGLPEIKKEHLTVCSNTLWVGHLSKLVHQEELSDTFGKYGDIISIDMIYPRGCAFIVMNRRQDAFKAMGSLKNHKLQGRPITISWAAGKGVKSKEWKDYWEIDLGVSYIPWSKLDKNTDLDALEEGGMFDEDTMPNWMKEKVNQKKENRENKSQNIFGVEGVAVDTSQPPPTAGPIMPGVPLIPPYPTMGPVPRMMPPPLGMPMPGNMMPAMPMAPTMVPGMPPPHMMMPPPGGIVPGFPPIPSQIDKTIPPTGGPQSEAPGCPLPHTFIGPNVGNMQMPPHLAPQQTPFGNMGVPPQFPHPLASPAQSCSTNQGQGEDHMDIEMEDENSSLVSKSGGSSGPPSIFNQPPPIFSPFSRDMGSMGTSENQRNERESHSDSDDRRETEFGRGARNRDSRETHSDFSKRDKDENRWSSDRASSGDRELQMHDRDRNSMDRDKMNNSRDFNRGNMNQSDQGRPIPSIWQESVPNFPAPLFGDNQRRGGMDLNIPPIDVNARIHFDIRRGNDFPGDDRRGIIPQQQQRDFFQNMNVMNNLPNLANVGNMGNRFGPPPQGMNRGGNSMPLRTGGFGPRLGPMFVRGPPRPGPPGSFNFNDRPQFEREDNRGRMRNGDLQNRRGRSNWRDEDENRRGNSGGNRFQNRDRDAQSRDKSNDRDVRDRDRGRDRNRGDRDKGGGGGNGSGHDRNNDRDGRNDRNSDNQRDNKNSEAQSEASNTTQKSQYQEDTEEDWDKELSDHNFENEANNTQHKNENVQNYGNENLESWDSTDENNSVDEQRNENRDFEEGTFSEEIDNQQSENYDESVLNLNDIQNTEEDDRRNLGDDIDNNEDENPSTDLSNDHKQDNTEDKDNVTDTS